MKILYVEDEIAHVELAQRTLEDNAQHEIRLVHAETIRAALDILDSDPDIDLILTDLRLPDGSGMDLLKRVRERDMPPAVVLVTGQGDQDVAVNALKAGAADYLVKQSDYLHRLPVVIANAIAQNRLAREQAALREAEVKYQTLVEQTPAVVFLDSVDDAGSTLYISPRIEELTGYPPEKWTAGASAWMNAVHPEDRERILAADERSRRSGEPFSEEYRFIRRDGRVIWLKEDTHVIRGNNGEPLYWQGILLDITREKENETALQRQLKELTVLHLVTLAGTEGSSENEIIQRVVQAASQIYNEVCGVLLVNEKGTHLIPHPSYLGADTPDWMNEAPVSKGLTGQSVQTGRPVRMGDVTRSPEYIPIANDIRSELCVPIRVNTRIIGVLDVESRKPYAYDEEDEQFLNTVTSGLGTALERLRLFREEEQRARELNTLYQATKSLTQSLKPEIIGQSLIEVMEELLGYEYGAVLILDEVKQQIVPLALSRKGATEEDYRRNLETIAGLQIKPGEGFVGWVVEHGRPARSGDVRQDERYRSVREGIRSELCVPLTARNKVIGAINIETTRLDAYTEKDEGILSALASSAAIAFENATLYETELIRRENAEALREATVALTSTVELPELYQIILDSLVKLIPYDSASIEILQDNYYEIVAGRGIPENLIGKKYRSSVEKWGGEEAMQHPIIIRDVRSDERFTKFPETGYIRGWMGIPLLTQGRAIGLLNMDSRIPGFFTEEHGALGQTLGNQAAIAIEKARLFHEQNRRSKIIETLAEIANEIATTRDVIPALEKISQRALELLRANNIAIYLLQDDGVTLKPITAYGTYRSEILSHVRRVGEGITGQVFLNGRPEIINDLAKDSRKAVVPGTSVNDSNFDTLMSSPLILRGQPIGVVNAWRRTDGGLFNETELNFLVSIANQASICIESGRLFQETKRQAQEAAAIAEVGRYISSTLQVNLVLERIASHAKELLRADISAVYLVDENGTALNAIAALGEDSDAIKMDPLQIGAGILGSIARQKIGEFVNDTAKDPRAITIKGTEQIPLEHIMGVPILFGDNLTGLLAVWRVGEKQFNHAELEFASRLAQQAAIALENARLFEAELKRREQAEVLQEVTASLSTSLDMDKLYQTILDSLSRLIPHDSASIFLEKGKGEMEIVAARGFPEETNIIGKVFSKTAKWHELYLYRKTIILSDAQANPDFEKWDASAHIRGWMGVPMVTQDNVIGFLNLDSHRVNAFTERDATLAQTFANSAAVAIQNARLFASEREQFERESAILSLMRAAASSLDLGQVLHTILDQLIKLVRADSGCVQLVENDQLRVAAAIGFDRKLFAEHGSVRMKDFPLNQYVVQKQEAVRIDDVWEDQRYIRVRGLPQTRSFLIIPLITKGTTIGLITLDHTQPAFFTERDVEIGVAIANNAAITLTNARLYDETQRRLKELEIINRVSTSLRVAQSLDEMLPILLNETLELVNTHHGSIWLYDPSSNMLKQQIASGAEARLKHTSIPPYQGVVGHTFTTGKPYVSAELKSDPLLFEGNRESMMPGLSGTCIPIQSTAGPVGVLMVSVEAGRQIKEEMNLLGILSEITGNAIHRSQLYEQSQRQVRRLTTLRDIDSAIASSFDLRLTLSILIDQTLSHLNVDAVDIALYHAKIQSLTYLVSSGFRTTSPTRPQMRIGEGLAGQVIMRQQTYHVTDLQNAPEARNEMLVKREGFTTYIGIPLIVKGQIKGVFEVFHRSSLSPTPDWMDFLHTLAAQAAIAIDNSHLFENLQHSNQELIQAYDTTLEGWARALELRDRETEGHTRRVTELTLRLARYMGLKDNDLVNVRRGVLLHDIGKMGVPDNILKKTGPLSDFEWTEMRQHPVYAYNLLAPIEYLRDALDIPYCHHEHWDGSGYPRGLKGTQIPLAARIFSVIDIWDALLSDRPYRKAWPRDKVIEYLHEISGKTIDPHVLEMFMKMIDDNGTETG